MLGLILILGFLLMIWVDVFFRLIIVAVSFEMQRKAQYKMIHDGLRKEGERYYLATLDLYKSELVEREKVKKDLDNEILLRRETLHSLKQAIMGSLKRDKLSPLSGGVI